MQNGIKLSATTRLILDHLSANANIFHKTEEILVINNFKKKIKLFAKFYQPVFNTKKTMTLVKVVRFVTLGRFL